MIELGFCNKSKKQLNLADWKLHHSKFLVGYSIFNTPFKLSRALVLVLLLVRDIESNNEYEEE